MSKVSFFSLFATWMFVFAGSASAGKAVILTDAQLDRVAAGAVASATGLADASGNLAAQTLTFTLSTVDPLQHAVVATGLSTASAASFMSPAAATATSSAFAQSR
jgi:hypothetical protein